jgi:hypothetical protein
VVGWLKDELLKKLRMGIGCGLGGVHPSKYIKLN